MNKQNNRDKLQSRRQFFKKTASFVIPMMGIVATGGLDAFLSSCSKDDDPLNDEPQGCKTCTNSCGENCYTVCVSSCRQGCGTDCAWSCETGCRGVCDYL